MIIKPGTASTRQKEIVVFEMLYRGLCTSYWTEETLSRWLSLSAKGIDDEVLGAAIDYYRMVIAAHLQKTGNIFGHLEREGTPYGDKSIGALLAVSPSGEAQSPPFVKERLLATLLPIMHLKAAHYRTLALYAKSIRLSRAGSILQRMYDEECEAIEAIYQKGFLNRQMSQ